MNSLGRRIAAEALALVGTPFRLHGRDPAHGLDCIGLVALALARARGSTPVATPAGYRLRNSRIAPLLAFAARAGLIEGHGPIEPGDVLHTAPGPGLDHLLVATGPGSFVHAHAGLRRVVAMPGFPIDPVRHRWRAS